MALSKHVKDAEIASAAITRLRAMAGVTSVVAGHWSGAGKHRNKPGEMKIVGWPTGTQATVRIYTKHGIQDAHVYTAKREEFTSQILARVVKPTTPCEPDPVVAAPRQAVQPGAVIGTPKRAMTAMAAAMSTALTLGKGTTAPVADKAPPEPKPFEPARISRPKRGQPIYPSQPAPMKPATPVADTSVQGRLVTVTPDIACNWLERNTKNRKLRDTDVKKYAADIRAGRWKPGGNIIKFDTDGNIVNGQHVLWAVIEAGMPAEMYVLSGLDPSVVLVEDDHARRTLGDVVKIQHPGWAVGNKHSGIATMLYVSIGWAEGLYRDKWSAPRQEQIVFLEKHFDAIQFAHLAFGSNRTRRGVAIAPVMAVLARAYYTVDQNRLRRFAQVVQTGIVESVDENAAVLLRNQLMANVGLMSSTMLVKQEIYYKVERALRAFLDGESLKVLKVQAVGDELFPLPEEPRKRRRRTQETK